MGVTPMSLAPSTRARAAEKVAHAVTGGRAPTDRLCELVAELRRGLGVDHAQVSIISDRQLAVVVDGRLSGPDLDDPDAPVVSPLEDTLCVVAVRAGHQVGIADTAHDDRVASTPPVLSGRIGSYLGSPIRLPAAVVDGVEGGVDAGRSELLMIGVLCIYNARVHEWTFAERDELERTALLVAAELDRICVTARGAA